MGFLCAEPLVGGFFWGAGFSGLCTEASFKDIPRDLWVSKPKRKQGRMGSTTFLLQLQKPGLMVGEGRHRHMRRLQPISLLLPICSH